MSMKHKLKEIEELSYNNSKQMSDLVRQNYMLVLARKEKELDKILAPKHIRRFKRRMIRVR